MFGRVKREKFNKAFCKENCTEQNMMEKLGFGLMFCNELSSWQVYIAQFPCLYAHLHFTLLTKAWDQMLVC